MRGEEPRGSGNHGVPVARWWKYDGYPAGRCATIALAGPELLGNRLLTKDLAFTESERDAFRLRGLLPDRVLRIEEQEELELEHLRRKSDALEAYITRE